MVSQREWQGSIPGLFGTLAHADYMLCPLPVGAILIAAWWLNGAEGVSWRAIKWLSWGNCYNDVMIT